jgi:hypothetical protein
MTDFYNFELVTTYKQMDTEDEADMMFKIQFLQVFQIENGEYDADRISDALTKLYEKFKFHNDVREIISNHPLYQNQNDENQRQESQEPIEENNTTENSELIFCMMYSYNTFDLFHKCLVEIHRSGVVSPELKTETINAVKSVFSSK